MHFPQMLLVFIALITLVYSVPTGSEQNNTITLAQNVTNTYDAPEDKKPLTVIVEDKNPKSESVVVEFVYSSNGENSISKSKVTDKDKYTVDSSLHKEVQDQIQNLKEKSEEKSVQKISIARAQKQVNEPKLGQSHMVNDLRMEAQTSLIPEEVSPLSEKWPKYFYDAFNPIKPFPEMQYDKQNQINAQRVQRENADLYLPYYEKERKEPINIAGPPLSPLSFYDREFNVPIFD